jgi:hypothetical protein
MEATAPLLGLFGGMMLKIGLVVLWLVTLAVAFVGGQYWGRWSN